MELQKFMDKIMKALEDYFGPEVKVKTHTVYKNNGILLQGICAMEKGRNIAPTVYINQFFEEYQKGVNFGQIVREIVNFMEQNQVAENLNVDFFLNYESVKKRLVLRLIHREKNKELLKQIPYVKFLDLAVICHCTMDTEEIGNGSVLIHKHHLENWGIEEETLFQDAYENSPRIEPGSILKMSDMMKQVLRDSAKEEIDEISEEDYEKKEKMVELVLENMAREIDEQNIPMYVLTNARRYYGAASLVYPDMLETIAELLEDDFYVLPSSVHEIIFVGKASCVEETALNEMVTEVNRTQVEEEEWLSDHVYLYQRANQEIISITNH